MGIGLLTPRFGGQIVFPMNKESLLRYGIRRGDRQLMVDMNRNLVLNVLRTGAVSRAEVVRATGLSPATVSTIVTELIANRLVVETGQGKSTGGRPPQVLKLNDTSNYVVGLKLMSHAISVVITDLNAEVVHAEVAELPAELAAHAPRKTAPAPETGTGSAPKTGVPVDQVLRAVGAAVRDAVGHAGIGAGSVVGVGAGLGGLVDGESGLCRYSPAFGWYDVQVAAPLAEDLGLPVLVDNDVNTLTIAEQWFGRGHGVDHFLVVTVGEGIGAGIVINGKLYQGADGGAGELGHLPVAGCDVLCSCGSRGCLEAVASDGAIVRQARMSGATGVETITDVRLAAEQGDQACVVALQEAGTTLGLGIAGIVNVLNPRLVILGGEGIAAGPLRFDAMAAALRAHVFGGLVHDVRLIAEPIDDVTWARGAACVVLGELFAAPVHRSGTFAQDVMTAAGSEEG
jgi:N-acetylglucosamine repressor